MQRKRKHTGRKEVFCILLCIMMIVGTAFSAAAQSADGESAEPSAAGFQESEREQQNSGDTALSVVSGQEAADRSAGSNAALTEEGGESGYGENTSNVKDDEGNPEDSGTQINMEENGSPDTAGNNSDDDRGISTAENDSEFGEDGEKDGSGEESVGLDEVGAGEGDESDGEGEDTESDDTEDLSGDISWYDPAGSSYTISSAEQLAGVAYLVNKGVTTFSTCTLTLAEDIDLSGMEWEPIGFSSSYSFAGTFDGAGHTISNLSINSSDAYVGLFGYLTGDVQNLHMENAIVVSQRDAENAGETQIGVGAVAGYCASGGFQNLKIRASVTLKTAADSAENYVGGIAGYCDGSLNDIDFDGAVTAEDASASSPTYVGGAAGYSGGKVYGVMNTAPVTLTDTTASEKVYLGGIAGYLTGEEALLNCGNTGTVSASVPGTIYVGGLGGETDITSIKNCFNQASVKGAAGSRISYSGGLFGVIGHCEMSNCYNSNKEVSGSTAYYGYLVGNVTVTDSTCKYTYWPGSGSSTTRMYGLRSNPLKASATCMGINRIATQENTTLTERLNAYSLKEFSEAQSDNMYMWELAEGAADNDPPFFREGALYPILPATPDLSLEKTEFVLHARDSGDTETVESDDTSGGASDNTSGGTDDSEYSCELKVGIQNADSSVEQEYQWQISANGKDFSDIAGENVNSSSYIVSAGEPGISYYRLKVLCHAPYADLDKTVFSDFVKVTTGWRITFADGGMFDGSESVTGASLPEGFFPVLSGDGVLALQKASKEGKYFLGWDASYEEGKQYVSGEYVNEYDTSQIQGDITFHAIFREAARVNVTFHQGDENTLLKEGVTPESLSLTGDEGTEIMLPDANDYFTYEGYRFIGWAMDSAAGEGADEESGEGGDESGDSSGTDGVENAGSDETSEGGELNIDSGSEDRGDDSSAAGENSGEHTGRDADNPEETVLYQPGSVYILGDRDITFRAVWSKLYTVTYLTGSSGVAGEVPEPETYIEGEKFAVKSADSLTKTGYAFKGWRDPEKKIYKAGATYEMPAYDVTFTAQWSQLIPIGFIMSEPNLSVSGTVPDTIYAELGSYIQLPDQGDMFLEGYRFLGWTPLDTDDIYPPGSYMCVQMDDYLTGVWSKIYHISFDKGSIPGAEISGDDPEPVEVVEGEKIMLPTNVYTVKTNDLNIAYYLLSGWKNSTNGIDYTPGRQFEAPASDVAFTASWKKMSTDEVWSGDTAESYSKGEGTEENPYKITTAAELALIAKETNEGKDTADTYYSLEADLDLADINWTPIGNISPIFVSLTESYVRPFEGHFMGNGHTLYNLHSAIDITGVLVDVGLFGAISDQGSVSDLNIEGATLDISSAGSDTNLYGYKRKRVGMISGYSEGEISGCSVSGELKFVESTGSALNYTYPRVGSIVGESVSSSITDCISDVDITFMYDVGNSTGFPIIAGGIAGKADNTTISGCENAGSVTASGMLPYYSSNSEGDRFDTDYNLLGGIVGYALNGSQISDCENTGDITGSSAAMTGAEGIGGIAGCNNESSIENCTNAGAISETGPDEEKPSLPKERMHTLGGISGYACGDISECDNTGNINLHRYAVDSISYRIGGIAGTSDADISESTHNGTIEVSDALRWGAANVYAGGIAGELTGGSLMGCYSLCGKMQIGYKDTNLLTYLPEKYRYGGLIGRITSSAADAADNCYWLCGRDTSDTSSGEIVEDCAGLPVYADSDNKIAMGEKTAGKTAEQFSSGEIAYYIDGGKETHRNVWTQDANPERGTPSVYKVTSSTDGNGTILLSDGEKVQETIFAKCGSTIKVIAEVSSDETAVGSEYLHHTDQHEDGSSTDYYYQDYMVYSMGNVIVTYADSEVLDITGSLSFPVKECDAEVSASFNDNSSENAKIESRLVRTVVNPAPPEDVKEPESNGSGGGGGKGRGDGNQNGNSHGPGGTDPNNGPSVPGTNPSSNPIPSNPSSTVISDNPTLVALPSAHPQSDMELQQNPEVTEAAAAPDSGGSGEPEDPIEEEVTEEVEEDMTMFEVIQDTITSNPLMILFLLILLIILLIIGGYSRYRKNNGGYSKYGRK